MPKCCINAERGIYPCTQECLNETLAHELRWLARHRCRGGKDSCQECRRTSKVVQILREDGAKLPSEVH